MQTLSRQRQTQRRAHAPAITRGLRRGAVALQARGGKARLGQGGGNARLRVFGCLHRQSACAQLKA